MAAVPAAATTTGKGALPGVTMGAIAMGGAPGVPRKKKGVFLWRGLWSTAGSAGAGTLPTGVRQHKEGLWERALPGVPAAVVAVHSIAATGKSAYCSWVICQGASCSPFSCLRGRRERQRASAEHCGMLGVLEPPSVLQRISSLKRYNFPHVFAIFIVLQTAWMVVRLFFIVL